MQFAVKIDQVEDFLKNAQEFDNIDNLRELLLQQEHHTKGIVFSWQGVIMFWFFQG